MTLSIIGSQLIRSASCNIRLEALYSFKLCRQRPYSKRKRGRPFRSGYSLPYSSFALPYYLLAKLYAEPDFRKPDKLEQMVEIVLTKEPKIQSSAIREMRDEVKKMISR